MASVENPSNDSAANPIERPASESVADVADEKGENQTQKLEQSTQEVFTKLGLLVNAELAQSTSEYQLLERMNNLAAGKYSVMADQAAALASSANSLQEKYQLLLPYLQQIDQLDANSLQLEALVGHLDDYSKRLETQFKTALSK